MSEQCFPAVVPHDYAELPERVLGHAILAGRVDRVARRALHRSGLCCLRGLPPLRAVLHGFTGLGYCR